MYSKLLSEIKLEDYIFVPNKRNQYPSYARVICLKHSTRFHKGAVRIDHRKLIPFKDNFNNYLHSLENREKNPVYGNTEIPVIKERNVF